MSVSVPPINLALSLEEMHRVIGTDAGRGLINVHACPLLSEERTSQTHRVMSVYDAVDGARSAASMCQRVVALKQTTLRGAVHG
jgi:hypothetical protein